MIVTDTIDIEEIFFLLTFVNIKLDQKVHVIF